MARIEFAPEVRLQQDFMFGFNDRDTALHPRDKGRGH